MVVVTLRTDGETLRLLVNAQAAAFELAVVVDCGASTPLRNRVDDWSGPMSVVFVDPGGNIGYGPGGNRGADVALDRGGEILVFANPDVHCDAQALRALAARCRRGRLVVPQVGRPDGRVFLGGRVEAPRGAIAAPAGEPVTWVSTALVAIHADDWRSVGGFDPRFFIYWDDVDLSRRLSEAGCRLVVDRGIAVTHQGRGSRPGADGEAFYCYLNCRNRLLYALKHDRSRRRVLRWVWTSPVYAWHVADVCRDGALRRATASLAGTIAGLWQLAVIREWGPPPRRMMSPSR